MIVFSNKAYNAIIRESFDKDPVETGGILLGHILDNGVWIVIEVLPPGIKCIFERAYFEYDDAFVNYLAQSVANQYKISLELLGLWHRHPGSMDVFSSTDDGTNTTFAQQNPNGVISGLVNIDPRFRLTMYHMDNPGNMIRQYNRPNYERIEIEVGDDIIPEEYFQLKYYDGEDNNLNPIVERSHTRMSRSVRTEGTNQRHSSEESIDIRNITNKNLENSGSNNYAELEDENSLWINDYKKIWALLKKNKIASLIALILVIASIFSIKTVIDYGKSATEYVISWFNDNKKEEPKITETKFELTVGSYKTLQVENLKNDTDIKWKSSDNQIATVSKKGEVKAVKEGEATISLYIGNDEIGKCEVTVKSNDKRPDLPQYTLSHTTLQMLVGQKDTLGIDGAENKEVTWKSNADIAIVNNGEVEAINKGSTDIIAIIDNEKLKCSIQVLAKSNNVEDSDIQIKIKTIGDSGTGQLGIGEVAKMYLKTIDSSTLPDNVDKTSITWTSEDSNIATVDNTGRIKAINEGTVNISVFYKGAQHDSFKLTVIKKRMYD